MRRQSPGWILTSLALASALTLSTACYHSIIETGLEPGPTGYHEKWETAWLVGLIPAEVDARGICGGPWARVETQQSFLNGLVTALTLGIYAPHEVEVVCAASQSGARQPPDDDPSGRDPLPASDRESYLRRRK